MKNRAQGAQNPSKFDLQHQIDARLSPEAPRIDSIEGPQGGTPPPPNFEMGVWACGAEILCAVMCV